MVGRRDGKRHYIKVILTVCYEGERENSHHKHVQRKRGTLYRQKNVLRQKLAAATKDAVENMF